MVRSASLPKGIEVTHTGGLAGCKGRLLATHCDSLADLADYCSTGCKGMPGVASVDPGILLADFTLATWQTRLNDFTVDNCR